MYFCYLGAMLGAGWRCGWRANALHFTRPTDVRKHSDKRPTVVEIAAQRQVLQKANGWKVHHLTAQMEDLVSIFVLFIFIFICIV